MHYGMGMADENGPGLDMMMLRRDWDIVRYLGMNDLLEDEKDVYGV